MATEAFFAKMHETAKYSHENRVRLPKRKETKGLILNTFLTVFKCYDQKNLHNSVLWGSRLYLSLSVSPPEANRSVNHYGEIADRVNGRSPA